MHLYAKLFGHAALIMLAPAGLLQEHTHDSIEDAATALKCVAGVPAPMQLPLLLWCWHTCSTAAVRWGLAHCRHCLTSASVYSQPCRLYDVYQQLVREGAFEAKLQVRCQVSSISSH